MDVPNRTLLLSPLCVEAQRTVERLHEERKRRLRLLEEKAEAEAGAKSFCVWGPGQGDLELTVQDDSGDPVKTSVVDWHRS